MPVAKKEQIVTLGEYDFIKRGRRVLVATQRKEQKELAVITLLYRKWKEEQPRPGPAPTEKFVLCQRPECNNAFCAPEFRTTTDKTEAKYCSGFCSSEMKRKQPADQRKKEEQEQAKSEPIARIKSTTKLSQFKYRVGDLVQDQNPASTVYKRKGRIFSVDLDQKVVQVSFGESFGVTRVYQEGLNLDDIALLREKRKHNKS